MGGASDNKTMLNLAPIFTIAWKRKVSPIAKPTIPLADYQATVPIVTLMSPQNVKYVILNNNKASGSLYKFTCSAPIRLPAMVKIMEVKDQNIAVVNPAISPIYIGGRVPFIIYFIILNDFHYVIKVGKV